MSNNTQKKWFPPEGWTSKPFASDLLIKIRQAIFYLDAAVVCDDATDNNYITESAVIIVEDLTKSPPEWMKGSKNGLTLNQGNSSGYPTK